MKWVEICFFSSVFYLIFSWYPVIALSPPLKVSTIAPAIVEEESLEMPPAFWSPIWDLARDNYGDHLEAPFKNYFGQRSRAGCGLWSAQAKEYLLRFRQYGIEKVCVVRAFNKKYLEIDTLRMVQHYFILFLYKRRWYLADGTISQYDGYEELTRGLLIPLADLLNHRRFRFPYWEDEAEYQLDGEGPLLPWQEFYANFRVTNTDLSALNHSL